MPDSTWSELVYVSLSKPPQVMVELAHLKSYAHMGQASITCAQGCMCDSTVLDGLHAEHTSQVCGPRGHRWGLIHVACLVDACGQVRAHGLQKAGCHRHHSCCFLAMQVTVSVRGAGEHLLADENFYPPSTRVVSAAASPSA